MIPALLGQMISDSSELKEFLSGQSTLCAIDTEADSLHRYSESLCLLQFSDGERHVLIDPLAVDDLTPLSDYLSSATCWMHGADYDMHMLRQHLGVVPPLVFDTQIGARLLGVRQFGYANLVAHYMDVELQKTSQKADWAKRPLTPVMEEYALNDVIYLLPMADMIVEQLKEKGRYDWFVESCEAARQKSLNKPVEREDRWRIKGSGRMSPSELRYLKALWEWRDVEAASWDKPPFMVLGNKKMLEWVEALDAGHQIALPRHYRAKRVSAFHKAVKAARQIPEDLWPAVIRGKRRKKDPAFESRLDALIAKRNKVGESLDIDSSLIAPRSVLEALAGQHEGATDLLLKWQRSLLEV